MAGKLDVPEMSKKYEVGQLLYCGRLSQNVGSVEINRLEVAKVGRVYLYADDHKIRIRDLVLENGGRDVQCYLSVAELEEEALLEEAWYQFKRLTNLSRKVPAVLDRYSLQNLQDRLFRVPPDRRGLTMYFVITVDDGEGYFYFDRVPAKDEAAAVALVKKARPYAKSSEAYDEIWMESHLHMLRTISADAALAELAAVEADS